MRTWMMVGAVVTLVALGVALAVVVADMRDPTRRPDASDDHAWHCTSAVGLDLGICVRSASYCDQIQASAPRHAACVPQPVATCFTIRKLRQDEVRRQCFPTIGSCDAVRFRTRGVAELDVLDECEPLDAAAHDRNVRYARIAVIPLAVALVMQMLGIAVAWRGRRRRTRAG